MRAISSSVTFVALLSLSGCAMYASRIREPRAMFEQGNYAPAIEQLRKYADKHDNDELLYLMDLATVQHNAGQYADAITTLRRADKIAEVSDYTKISEEAASVLLNDDVKAYKGEDFEKILIHVYLAIDYTLLNKWESALVECRRVNHMLDQMISKGQLPYERNRFAKYLAASLFEAQGEYNDAFVDYRQLRKWDPATPYLGVGLLRMADALKASQEFETYQKEYPGETNFRLGKNEGEILVIFEQGRSPIKVPSYQSHLLPMFVSRSYASNQAEISVPTASKAGTATTETLFNIETTAIRELDHRIGLILAKKIGGVVAKEMAAKGVQEATKSEFLGALTSFVLHATDHADLRSWSTLPARLQIARMKVPTGKHQVKLDILMQHGGRVQGAAKWDDVVVKPGQRVFLHHREMN